MSALITAGMTKTWTLHAWSVSDAQSTWDSNEFHSASSAVHFSAPPIALVKRSRSTTRGQA